MIANLEPNKLGSSPIVAAEKYFLQKCRFSQEMPPSPFHVPRSVSSLFPSTQLATEGGGAPLTMHYKWLQRKSAKHYSLSTVQHWSQLFELLARLCLELRAAAAQSRAAALTIVFGKTDQ